MSDQQQQPSNELAESVLKVYGPTLKRMRDGTHFEHCWQDHWSCTLDMCLAEMVRLQRELDQSRAAHKSTLAAMQSPIAQQWMCEPAAEASKDRVSDLYLENTLREISRAKALDSQMISTAFLQRLLTEIIERRAAHEPRADVVAELLRALRAYFDMGTLDDESDLHKLLCAAERRTAQPSSLLRQIGTLAYDTSKAAEDRVREIQELWEGAAQPPPAAPYESMFNAAVSSLAEISRALDIPDEVASVATGNEEILQAILKLKQRADQPLDIPDFLRNQENLAAERAAQPPDAARQMVESASRDLLSQARSKLFVFTTEDFDMGDQAEAAELAQEIDRFLDLSGGSTPTKFESPK